MHLAKKMHREYNLILAMSDICCIFALDLRKRRCAQYLMREKIKYYLANSKECCIFAVNSREK